MKGKDVKTKNEINTEDILVALIAMARLNIYKIDIFPGILNDSPWVRSGFLHAFPLLLLFAYASIRPLSLSASSKYNHQH